MPGAFVVFEGGEFVGKTTQCAIIAKKLRDLGHNVIETREPGGTPEGQEIRKKIFSGTLSREEELDAFIEDRRLNIEYVVEPALRAGKIVLCDRFLDSTIVYQHFGRGWSLETITKKDRHARRDIKPALVILLDMDPKKAFLRRSGRNEALTIFEEQKLAFHKAVRTGYLSTASLPDAVGLHVVINADQTVRAVTEAIWREIQTLF